jgi:preprotein translocase subunit SecB
LCAFYGHGSQPGVTALPRRGIQQESENAMAATNGGQHPYADNAPAVSVLSQYIKDLSFENPNAPESVSGRGPQPSIKLDFNVNVKPLAENDVEVELRIEGRTEQQDKVLFNVDLIYAGVFRLRNVPPELRQPIVLIECPRLLFPFARQIISDITQSGGFPPLLLDPVDFTRLYHERFMPGPGQDQPQAQT